LGVRTGEAKGQTVRLLWRRQNRCLVENKDTGLGGGGIYTIERKILNFYVN